MTIETLKLMLGGEDRKLHASKLNAIVKKKIKYMINDDLDVAKDFLDLIEILKQHKATHNKELRDNILKNHAEAGVESLSADQQQPGSPKMAN